GGGQAGRGRLLVIAEPAAPAEAIAGLARTMAVGTLPGAGGWPRGASRGALWQGRQDGPAVFADFGARRDRLLAMGTRARATRTAACSGPRGAAGRPPRTQDGAAILADLATRLDGRVAVGANEPPGHRRARAGAVAGRPGRARRRGGQHRAAVFT